MNRTLTIIGLTLLAAPLSAQQAHYGGEINTLGSQPGGRPNAHFGEIWPLLAMSMAIPSQIMRFQQGLLVL